MVPLSAQGPYDECQFAHLLFSQTRRAGQSGKAHLDSNKTLHTDRPEASTGTREITADFCWLLQFPPSTNVAPGRASPSLKARREALLVKLSANMIVAAGVVSCLTLQTWAEFQLQQELP